MSSTFFDPVPDSGLLPEVSVLNDRPQTRIHVGSSSLPRRDITRFRISCNNTDVESTRLNAVADMALSVLDQKCPISMCRDNPEPGSCQEGEEC